jgi:hypothetical protein
MRASAGVATLVFSVLACVFGFGSNQVDLITAAQAQSVPKSLEGGGAENIVRAQKNQWIVGVAGGQLSGTYGGSPLPARHRCRCNPGRRVRLFP